MPELELSSVDDAPAEHPGFGHKILGRFFAIYLLVRWLVLLGAVLATVLVVSALVGAITASTATRLALGLGVALLLPLIVRWRLKQLVARRFSQQSIGGSWFFIGFNLAAMSLVCLGFSNDVGRSLRRRGDWFLGETDGWLPRRYRQGMLVASRWLERFDLPEEARDLLGDAAKPQSPVLNETLKASEHRPGIPGHSAGTSEPEHVAGTSEPERAAGTSEPDHGTSEPEHAAGRSNSVWYHPLAGPTRAMPPWASCRFGAARPGRRPPECQLGHCGIDLFQPRGAPVFAVRKGVVRKIQRNADWGGSSGKYLWISHKDGAVISVYVHLDSIRSDLRLGSLVRGGEPIGTLGRTGIRRSAPHLHFGIAIKRPGRRMRFIDPEPLLWLWRLPAPNPPASPDGAAVALCDGYRRHSAGTSVTAAVSL